ncbi:hypothetical protein IV500_16910 [Paeniglutamicibacter antarcticus]|uniref:Uncharacterized protein n=1 Tax=Arthrobacter terrae TaxID=2935737 RepID=A0A931G6V1_9MICC|nr:ETEC_3214 domain-containing protein [Arthrobacter terrae]MBG0741055.1 hypothetical protein [Arthrobacter terrae]
MAAIEPPPDGPPATDSRFVRWIDGAKRHRLVVAATAALAVVTFFATAFGYVGDSIQTISNWANPHRSQYEALAVLDLDLTPAYVESKLGQPNSIVNWCVAMGCPASEPRDTVKIYIFNTPQYVVRAVFDSNSLALYAVTLMSADLQPPMTFGESLGKLGTVTFEQAQGIHPTDAAIHMGPASSAYVEVLAGGRPAHYQGLFLAWAPAGWASSPMRWDMNGARTFDQASQLPGGFFDPTTVSAFRAGSTPNTFGRFRDNGGFVASVAHHAVQLIPLLYTGTEL